MRIPKKEQANNREKQYNVSGLKMSGISIAYFVQVLPVRVRHIKSSASRTNGLMWKIWLAKPNVKDWMRSIRPNLKQIMFISIFMSSYIN
jgi:hypothetical protein